MNIYDSTTNTNNSRNTIGVNLYNFFICYSISKLRIYCCIRY